MDAGDPQRSRRRSGRRGVAGLAQATLVALCALAAAAASAGAAAKPEIRAVWSSEVAASSARLRAEVNPEGAHTTYHFNYILESAYEANLSAGREAFAGAAKAPAGGDPSLGEGSTYVAAAQSVGGLAADTAYRYRLVATSSQGTSTSVTYALTTQALGGAQLLADGRGWEMVSPVDKNGGAVQGPGENYGGDDLQAAADGQSVTYTSSASFGAGGGNPGANQYLSQRTAAGWATENITAPTLSGAFGDNPDGVPYRVFSGDLARAVMQEGQRCGAEPCPRSFALREGGALTPLGPEEPDLRFAGASEDLRHVVLSTCAKLTADATEQPVCESGGPNLYEWSSGSLRLVNRIGADPLGSSDAYLAAPSGGVSADGSRVYFTLGEEQALYLREGSGGAVPVAELANFQTATPDGALAFYTKGGELFRYKAAAHTSEPIAAGVVGVLGASADGSVVYYQDAAGLERWDAGSVTQLAPGPAAAAESDWPPATGTARVSADGSRLLFLSSSQLTGYDNTDPRSPAPCPGEGAICDGEVYLWSAAEGLRCISCNPTGERPLGSSSIPGALVNGTTRAYKPRALSASGRRLFFDSADALVLADTDHAPDAYEWEAEGEGSCAAAGGCLSLLSSGRSAEGASFVDASASGADAFLLTDASLVASDPGSVDLYDARIGGGFPEPPAAIACEGDACQPLPSEPEDPESGTLREGAGNPPLPRIARCKHGFIRRHGKCVKLKKHKRHRKHRKARRG